MKFCAKCGSQMADDAAFCGACGYSAKVTNAPSKTSGNETLRTLAKVFMIVGTIAQASLIIPLAWCIPMTVHYFKCTKENRPVSTGFAVCTLLFVNTISGILMLVDNSN